MMKYCYSEEENKKARTEREKGVGVF